MDKPESDVDASAVASERPTHLFKPGQSGNPTGRPLGHRRLLKEKYGDDGAKLIERLEALSTDSKTPRKLKAEIDMWLFEQMFGRAPAMVGVEGGPSLVELLAQV